MLIKQTYSQSLHMQVATLAWTQGSNSSNWPDVRLRCCNVACQTRAVCHIDAAGFADIIHGCVVLLHRITRTS
jgi:hypothetical protein